MPVMIKAMRTDFFRWSSPVDFTVTGQVKVVTDVTETAVPDVVTAAVFKAQAHALGRGRAMNDKQRNYAHGYLQALKPKAPAKAVATVMITLRTMPHTGFDFFSMMKED